MDSASTSRPFVATEDKYTEYSAANRRTIELLGKLLEAAKRAQAQGKQVALNKIIFEANKLSNRLSISMEKPDGSEQTLTTSKASTIEAEKRSDSGPRRMFFTEALYLRNKQAMAEEARMYVPVRGEIVE